MKADFDNMNVEDALEYCSRHANQFKSDAYASGEDGERLYDCLIGILKSETIQPKDLPEYGMDYED